MSAGSRGEQERRAADLKGVLFKCLQSSKSGARVGGVLEAVGAVRQVAAGREECEEDARRNESRKAVAVQPTHMLELALMSQIWYGAREPAEHLFSAENEEGRERRRR